MVRGHSITNDLQCVYWCGVMLDIFVSYVSGLHLSCAKLLSGIWHLCERFNNWKAVIFAKFGGFGVFTLEELSQAY